MQSEKNNINELDDLLRKHFLNDEKAFSENSPLLEKTVLNERESDSPFYKKGEKLVSKLERDFGVRKFSIVKILIPVAAILTVALAIYGLMKISSPVSEKLEMVQAGESKMMKVTLPDGSLVWLNKMSSLSFPEVMKERKVVLKGNAYFEVVPDKKHEFVIETESTKITVTGTSFNIKQTSETVEVVVLTGSVIFSSEYPDKKSSVTLSPGEIGIYYNKDRTLISRKNEDPNFLSWKTGVITFNNVSFTEVTETLASFYGKEIILNDAAIGNCKIMLTIRNESFEEVLNELKLILNIEYNFNGDKVIVTGDGC